MTNISIAMATYNGAGYIQDQLISFVTQTLRPNELVVSDDCSTDPTLSIVREFAKTAPFEVVIHQNETRLGYKQNFIQATTLCKSDIIALSDQDDLWFPDKLETVVASFADPQVSLVYHNSIIADQTGRVVGFLHDASKIPHDQAWFAAFGHTMAFRKELAGFSHLWKDSVTSDNSKTSLEKESHDHWFFFLGSNLGKVVYINSPLVRHRMHGGNAEGISKQGIIGKWRDSLARRDFAFHLGAMSAEARGRTLKAIAEMPQYEDRRDLILKASMDSERISSLYQMRSNLYKSDSFLERVGIFSRLCRMEAYGSQGVWSLKSAVKDATAGAGFWRGLRN